jgi:CheY-like chemotaxis protein
MIEVKALIADDDDMNTALLEMILMQLGISQIDKAYNGLEAWEMFEDALCEEPYRVVFLDITMPGMNGIEVLKRIRNLENESDTRSVIIMATGDNTHDTIVKTLLDNDADDHIGKPFNREEISESLVRLGIL